MNNRIKEVRKANNLTQDEYAEKLRISKNYVCLLETGKKAPGDRLISDICREFNVSEDWLRHGEGEMFVPLTRDQEIADFMGEVLADPDASPRKALICAVKKLGPEEWATLAKVAREWVEGMEKSNKE